MNPKVKVALNVLGAIIAAYNAAILGGAGTKQAALVAAGAVVANLTGLYQQHPSAETK